MIGRLLLIALLALGNILYVSAQYLQLGLPPIINYTKQDYQAETQNWYVTEDMRGLIYLGNNSGLLEFDGTYWRTFHLPNRSIVRSIAADKTGRILVGGQDEVGFFQADHYGFWQYQSLVPIIPEAHRNFEDVWEIIITTDGTFWASQKYIFLQKDDDVSVFSTDYRFDGVFFLNDQLYVAVFGEGIRKWDGNDFQLISGGDFFSQMEVRSILPHHKSGILVCTKNNGIFHFAEGNSQAWAIDVKAYLVENSIYCALKLYNGNIALGTSHEGLLILNEQGKALINLSREQGLLNNSVLSLHEDRSHNLWLGLENGISYVEISSPFSRINSDMGVKGAGYSSIIHNNKIYLATNQGVFSRDWLEVSNSLYPSQFELVKNSRGPAWGLHKLGNHLFACQHKGTSRLSGDQFVLSSPYNGAWKLMQLLDHPKYAVEGNYDGLLLYEKKNGSTHWAFRSKLKGFSESSRVMEQDIDGNIWISHPYRGVFRLRLDPERDSIHSVDIYNSAQGFPSNLGINVARIQDSILFTTEEGVYKYDSQTDRFIPHDGFNRIFKPDKPIKRLIEDQNGTIWFVTEEEFGFLEIQDKVIEKKVSKLSFNRLRNRLINGFEHIYTYENNRVFIGTDDGFVLYRPGEGQEQSSELTLYIREVWITQGQDSLVFGGSFSQNGNLLSKQPQSQILSFQPNARDLRFSFSSPFFEDINEIRYQYFLEGQDSEWSEWTNKTEREYTNLSIGKHIFHVRAKNIYGLESEVVSYQFVILPHWYETMWARTFYLLLGLGFVMGIILHLRNRYKRKAASMKAAQARTLAQKQDEFLQEFKKSEAEIIRLRNEKLKAEVMHKNKELASSTMHLVQKGEILLKVKQSLEKIAKESTPDMRGQIRKVSRMIDDDIRLDKNWKQFEHHFDEVHGQFLQHLRAKFPNLTSKDQRLCAYLRMNLSTKEIAQLMNISVRGVEISRYRLRKKLDLDREENLNTFMMQL